MLRSLHLRECHHQVQDVHNVFLSQPYFLIGSFVLDIRHVLSTALLIKNKLVPVLSQSLFHSDNLKKHGSSLLAVKCANKHSIFFVLPFTLSLCYHRLLCENHWLLKRSDSVKGWFVSQSAGLTVSPAPESKTRGFGNVSQACC